MSLKNENDFIQRFGVIKKGMLIINQSNPRKKHRETLVKLDEQIKRYPIFTNEGDFRAVDMYVSLAITKIHFGLLEYLPPKNAIEQAFKYLAKSHNLIEKTKGKAL